MRFLILLLMISPASAACRLSTNDCATVAEELRIDAIQDIRTRMALQSSGLTPYQAEVKAITLQAARLKARALRLPVPIGNELGRQYLCEASPDNPRCR